jgi:hypothetical protein
LEGDACDPCQDITAFEISSNATSNLTQIQTVHHLNTNLQHNDYTNFSINFNKGNWENDVTEASVRVTVPIP